MSQWPQNAHPVEGVGAARLGKFAARLAGNGRMIQIAALEHLDVGFVSLTEALDLTTPAGRAMAGLLAIS